MISVSKQFTPESDRFLRHLQMVSKRVGNNFVYSVSVSLPTQLEECNHRVLNLGWRAEENSGSPEYVIRASYDVCSVATPIAMHTRTCNGNDTFPRHVTREPCSVTLFITSRSFVPASGIPCPRFLRSHRRADLNFIQIPRPWRGNRLNLFDHPAYSDASSTIVWLYKIYAFELSVRSTGFRIVYAYFSCEIFNK